MIEVKIELKDLQLVREYIVKGWTKHTVARTIDNKICYWNDPEACSYCVQGAIFKATMVDANDSINMQYMLKITDLLYKTYQEAYGISKSYINNTYINDLLISSQEEAIAWIDLAISKYTASPNFDNSGAENADRT